MTIFMPFAFGLGILLLDQWSKRAIQAQIAKRNLHWGAVLRLRFVPHRRRLYRRPGARTALVALWTDRPRLRGDPVSPRALASRRRLAYGSRTGAGGAASNLVDILALRFIVDYVDLGWWPVFNLADVAIFTGLAAALVG